MFSVKAILKIKESKGLKGQKNRYLASKLKDDCSGSRETGVRETCRERTVSGEVQKVKERTSSPRRSG